MKKMLSIASHATRIRLVLPLLALIVLLQMLSYASHLSSLIRDRPRVSLSIWTARESPAQRSSHDSFRTTVRATQAKPEEIKRAHVNSVLASDDNRLSAPAGAIKDDPKRLAAAGTNTSRSTGVWDQSSPDEALLSSYSMPKTVSDSNQNVSPKQRDSQSSFMESQPDTILEYFRIPQQQDEGALIEIMAAAVTAKCGIVWDTCGREEGGCLRREGAHDHKASPGNTTFNTRDKNKTLFTVVRNPYELFISDYYCPFFENNPGELEKLEDDHQDPLGPLASCFAPVRAKLRNHEFHTHEALNDYLMRRFKQLNNGSAHFIPQADLVFDEHGNQVIQHVLRFENLHADFHRMMKEYNRTGCLSEMVKNSEYAKEKRFTVDDLYPETITRINNLAIKDFRKFGYKMREPKEQMQLSTQDSMNISQATTGPPRVAFLFMTTNQGLNEDLWRRWFPQGDDRYSIVVHTVPSNTTVPLGPFFCPFAVRSVPTRWYELHDGMMQVLQFAFDQDVRAQSFVFVSDTSIPLVSFDILYNSALEDRNKSRFCWHKNDGPHWARTRPILGIDKEDVRKAEMWSAISRTHAQWILESRHLLDKWNRVFVEERRKAIESGISPIGVGAPDECLFPTFLTMKGAEFTECPLQKSPASRERSCCSTYVHWQVGNLSSIFVPHDSNILLSHSCKSGWPCRLLNLHEEGLLELQKRGYWMLRKVPPHSEVITKSGEIVPLNDALLMLHKGKAISQPKQKRGTDDNTPSFSCPAPP